MCQAFEAEERFVGSIEREYGSVAAFYLGKKPLKDYCRRHGDYWCGCSPQMRERQANPKVRAKREKRRKMKL